MGLEYNSEIMFLFSAKLSVATLSLSGEIQKIILKFSHPLDKNSPFYGCQGFFYFGLLSKSRL